LSGRIGASYATLGDLILIRVLYPGLFPQDCTCDWADDAPLETVANRSAPMAGGPNVDQARPGSGRALRSLRSWRHSASRRCLLRAVWSPAYLSQSGVCAVSNRSGRSWEHASRTLPTKPPVNAYTTEGWGELFLAEAGASAALGGLLFVAVSINLERIISIRSLPGAALATIVLLVAVLMVSTFALVPEQPRWVLGSEVLVVGIVAWSTVTGISLRALRAPIPNQPRFVPLISVVVTQAATLPMVVAGVSLLLGAGGGLYWLVPGMAFSVVVAVVNAWVLLVEVVR
jgi:hypothetical protein